MEPKIIEVANTTELPDRDHRYGYGHVPVLYALDRHAEWGRPAPEVVYVLDRMVFIPKEGEKCQTN